MLSCTSAGYVRVMARQPDAHPDSDDEDVRCDDEELFALSVQISLPVLVFAALTLRDVNPMATAPAALSKSKAGEL